MTIIEQQEATMRTRRTKVGIKYAGNPMLTATCEECGQTYTVLTADPHATLEHWCPTERRGPVWTLVTSVEGPRIPRSLTWAEHLAKTERASA